MRSSYIIHLDSDESERAFLEFLKSHTNIEVTPSRLVSKENSMVDDHGHFKRISLATEGSPISPEYLAWRLERSMSSPSISKDEFLAGVDKRKAGAKK
jgi:hypothetical protein